MAHYVSEIFEQPKSFGLRGDPVLWEYLRDSFSDVEFPCSQDEFLDQLLNTFKEFAGEYPRKGKRYYVKQFAEGCTGISKGWLQADFWLDRAIPLLISRLEEQNALYG